MLTSKRLRVGACQFNYLEGGPAEGGALGAATPLIFLHGWASAAYAFAQGLEPLARARRVIAPDLPGFNQSRGQTHGWGYAEFARAIRDLARALGVEAFHLAGHSTGGGIALELAATWPEGVRSLTLIDSSGVPLGHRWPVAARKGLEQVRQAWATRLAAPHWLLLTSSLFDFVFRTRTMWDTLRMPLKQDLRPRLAAVTAPAQVVWGEKDMTEPLAMGRELAAGLKGASFVCLPGAYHEWAVLRPELLAGTLERFIQAVESRR